MNRPGAWSFRPLLVQRPRFALAIAEEHEELARQVAMLQACEQIATPGALRILIDASMSQDRVVARTRGGEVLAPATPCVVCGSCGASVAPGKFCSHCGKAIPQKKDEPEAAPGAFCTGCGTALAADARFCGQCGQSREG